MWLYFNQSSSQLIGVPSSFDEGAVVIEATAIQRNRDGQQHITSTHFIIQVQPPKDEELMWSSDSGVIRYDSGDFTGLPNNEQLEQQCEWDENVFRVVLVLDISLNELDVERRVKLMENFANLISHDISGITMSTRQSTAVARLMDEHVVAAGPGDTNCTSHVGIEVSWFLGCGVTFPHLQDFIQVIEHNIKTTRIRKEVGFNVIGWQVIESQPPEPIKKMRRQKRQAMRTPIPTPAIVPSISSLTVHPTPFQENPNERFEVSMISIALMIPSSSSTNKRSSSASESVETSSLHEFHISTSSPMLVTSAETLPTSSTVDIGTSSMMESIFPFSQQKLFGSVNISQEYGSENQHTTEESPTENVFSTTGVVSELGESISSSVAEQSTESLEVFPGITVTTTVPMISFIEMSSVYVSSDLTTPETSMKTTSEISTLITPSPTVPKSSSKDPIERLSSYEDGSTIHTALPGASLMIQSSFESDSLPMPSFSEIGTNSAVSVGGYSSAAMTVQFDNTQSTVTTRLFMQRTSTVLSIIETSESDLLKSAQDSSSLRDLGLSERELLLSLTELAPGTQAMNITSSELLISGVIITPTVPLQLNHSTVFSSVPIPSLTGQPDVLTEGQFSPHVALPETITSTLSIQKKGSSVFPSDIAFSMSLESSEFTTNDNNGSVSMFTTQPLKTQEMRASSVLSDTFSSAAMAKVTNISNFVPVTLSEVSVSSVQNLTLVGPPRTAKLTVILESLSSTRPGGIYASAGYEDDLVTTTTELSAMGTEETESTVTIESKIRSTSLPFVESSSATSTRLDIPTESNTLTPGRHCYFLYCTCIL